MITETELCSLVEAKPEMMRAFQVAVSAVVEYRKEIAADQSGFWAKARLKKKQLAATFQIKQFASGLVFDNQPASEDDKRFVESWIINAAKLVS